MELIFILNIYISIVFYIGGIFRDYTKLLRRGIHLDIMREIFYYVRQRLIIDIWSAAWHERYSVAEALHCHDVEYLAEYLDDGITLSILHREIFRRWISSTAEYFVARRILR